LCLILRPTSICRFVFGDSVSRSPDGGSEGSRAATAFNASCDPLSVPRTFLVTSDDDRMERIKKITAEMRRLQEQKNEALRMKLP
jgi:hypothetical protein